MRFIFALLTFVIPAVASAGWIDKSGKSLADAQNRKAVGDFGAQVVFVADDKRMFELWGTPSETVNIQTIEKVTVNGQVNAFVVFSGCKPNMAGNCDVTAQYKVFQPNGKIYADTPPMEVWQAKRPPPGKSLELSVQYLKVVIELTDMLGKYVINTQVRDNVSGVVLELSAPFRAVKSK